jgi:hypothetical protein
VVTVPLPLVGAFVVGDCADGDVGAAGLVDGEAGADEAALGEFTVTGTVPPLEPVVVTDDAHALSAAVSASAPAAPSNREVVRGRTEPVMRIPLSEASRPPPIRGSLVGPGHGRCAWLKL